MNNLGIHKGCQPKFHGNQAGVPYLRESGFFTIREIHLLKLSEINLRLYRLHDLFTRIWIFEYPVVVFEYLNSLFLLLKVYFLFSFFSRGSILYHSMDSHSYHVFSRTESRKQTTSCSIPRKQNYNIHTRKSADDAAAERRKQQKEFHHGHRRRTRILAVCSSTYKHFRFISGIFYAQMHAILCMHRTDVYDALDGSINTWSVRPMIKRYGILLLYIEAVLYYMHKSEPIPFGVSEKV